MYWIIFFIIILLPVNINAETKIDSEILLDSSVVSVVETKSKIMSTSISKNGKYYRYKATLVWKKIPKVRSYDIIGIGFYNSLKVSSDIYFKQEYCYIDGRCKCNYINDSKIFNSGVGVIFKLPMGHLSSLKQTLHFDVDKNIDKTIIVQDIYTDYVHAIKNVSLDKIHDYQIIFSLGIILNYNSSIYYDSINTSRTTLLREW